jgi:hypothetical protein
MKPTSTQPNFEKFCQAELENSIQATADMPYDEKTAERIRHVMGGRRDIVEKKMMGGLAFTVGGGMCCYLSRKGYFLLRVTPDVRGQTLAMPNVKPTDFAGRRMSGFVVVEPEGFRTEAALAKWVQRGIDNALALTSRAPAKKAAVKKQVPAKKRAARSRARR